ncbi:MAG: histidine kinase [Actinobacteria bacterium]|nr:histidine kinase [Actinomycetota bacterium]
MRRREKRSGQSSSSRISQDLIDVLNILEIASVVISTHEEPLYFSPLAQTLGIIRDERISGEELLALIRVVRRTGVTQSGSIDLPRGPIGEGTRRLSVKVARIGNSDLIIALLSDESEAERIDAVRRDFVANISHELKTPIGALSILSEAVLGARSEPEAVEKFALRMQIEAKRLSDLVQEIINLSRLQDADPLLDAITVDIDEVIELAIVQSQLHADSRNIEIVRGDEVHLSAVGDRAQLVAAVHNLIENAINYSPDKTRVTVNSQARNGLIEISVIDQGIGISESDIDRIFERFYRVDPARSRETGGTGLGLSIVKHVARNHGGEVVVWSAPGVGSTFTLKLPIGEEIIEMDDNQ